MDEPYPYRAPASRNTILIRLIVGTALAAFLLGAAVIWLLARSGGGTAEVLGLGQAVAEAPTAAPESDAATTPATAGTTAASATPTAAVGPLDQRIAAMEQRLAQIDLQAAAAAGNASRAESLLIAFAARRAIERGVPLNDLEDQLRLRFGAAQPKAVETVIAAAKEPITFDRLLARLDSLEPHLINPPDEGVFDWISRELGELFVVRAADDPSPAPERRIARARLFLETNRADAAADEIRNLRTTPEAADWVADAERFSAARRALDLLELSAIREPRQLRDAEGNSVVQPSPAARP